MAYVPDSRHNENENANDDNDDDDSRNSSIQFH